MRCERWKSISRMCGRRFETNFMEISVASTEEHARVWSRRPGTGANSIRLHRFLSHHLPGHHDRARKLFGRARRPMALEESHGLPRPLSFLVEDLRGKLC